VEDQAVEIERHPRSLRCESLSTELRPGAAPRKDCAATPGPDSASDVGGGAVSTGALEGLVALATAPMRAWA